jgi:hypothetical protein
MDGEEGTVPGSALKYCSLWMQIPSEGEEDATHNNVCT